MFFGDDIWILTVVEAASGIGMMLGGIVISIWKGFKSQVFTMAISLFVMGVAVIGLGFPENFIIYIIMAIIMCGMLSIFNTVAITFLQTKIDKEYMGRVFGMITMFSSSLMPLGMLIFGPLADMMAIEIILIFSGIVVVLMAILLGKSTTLKVAEI